MRWLGLELALERERELGLLLGLDLDLLGPRRAIGCHDRHLDELVLIREREHFRNGARPVPCAVATTTLKPSGSMIFSEVALEYR